MPEPGTMLTRDSLRLPLPSDWEIICGFDTGAFMGAAFGIIPPDSPDILITDEFPNYRYVSGDIERLDLSDPEWAKIVLSAYRQYRPRDTKLRGWVDQNSQFKRELHHYHIHLQSNKKHLELRVEILREYTQAKRIFLAPWLKVLPYEMELAKWPDEHTSAGQFVRLKKNDHLLDCVEHITSRRPRSKALIEPKKESFLERYLRENKWSRTVVGDPHLGRL